MCLSEYMTSIQILGNTNTYVSPRSRSSEVSNNVFWHLGIFWKCPNNIKTSDRKKVVGFSVLTGQLCSKQKGNVPWMLLPHTLKMIFHWKHQRYADLKKKNLYHLPSDLFYKEQAKPWIPLKVLSLRLLYWQMKLCKQKVKVSSDLVLQGLHPSKGLTEVSKHLRLAKPP